MHRCCICPGRSLLVQVVASAQDAPAVSCVRPNKAAETPAISSYPNLSPSLNTPLDIHFLSKKYFGGSKKINPSWRCARGFIFFFKTTTMLYFLIMKGNELHVHEVHPRDEETFRSFYDEKILVQGASVRDVLRQFDELPLIINYGW